jgi:hypothetical protein
MGGGSPAATSHFSPPICPPKFETRFSEEELEQADCKDEFGVWVTILNPKNPQFPHQLSRVEICTPPQIMKSWIDHHLLLHGVLN